MKTVVHTNIDGKEIVVGFHDACIDPVATWANIKDRIENLEELGAVRSKKSEIAEQMEIATRVSSASSMFAKKGEKDRAQAYQGKFDEASSRIAELSGELEGLETAFEGARASLFESAAIFFTPGPGENMISSEDFEKFSVSFSALTEYEKLALDGEVVTDFRGKTFWAKKSGKWISRLILTLGEDIPKTGILEHSLTEAQLSEIEAQIEDERVTGLSVGDITSEVEFAQARAKSRAADIMTEERVSGASEDAALATAQTFYQSELKKINSKYGIGLA